MDLIQGLGISLGSFHYLIQWPKSSKTFISGGLRIITSSLLLSLLAVAFLSLPTLRNKIQSFTICLDLKLVGKLGVVRFFFLRKRVVLFRACVVDGSLPR